MKKLLLLSALILISAPAFSKVIPCDDENVYFAPYAWKPTATYGTPTREATFPGAYVKTVVKNTSKVGLIIDGTTQKDMVEIGRPRIEYSVDGLAFKEFILTTEGNVYTLPLAENLDRTKSHTVLVYFRSAHLGCNRWAGHESHLFIKGFEVDPRGTTEKPEIKPGLAMGFGDSITEGVGVDQLFTTWDDLTPNNARVTWFAMLCEMIGCEYGQFGSGGQGMINEQMAVPPLPLTWDKYDAETSRLVDGKLVPQPDYIMCAMGTNDERIEKEADAYIDWIKAVRKAAPKSYIVIVVPPSGVQRNNLQKTAAAFKKDKRVLYIDTVNLNEMITVRPPEPTGMAYDAVHPTEYGQGMFAGCVAVQLLKLIK